MAEYAKAEQPSDEKLRAIITNADFVRKELLQKIPIPEQTATDKKEVEVFAQALENPKSLPGDEAARYLVDLARRVPPPK